MLRFVMARSAGEQARFDWSNPPTHQRDSGVCESAPLLHIAITASWTFESRSMARRELFSCDGTGRKHAAEDQGTCCEPGEPLCFAGVQQCRSSCLPDIMF